MNDEDLRKLLEVARPPLPRPVVDFLRSFDTREIRVQKCEFVVSEELWGTAEEARFVFTTTERKRELPFSERLNAELLRRHVRMATADQEALRFGAHALSNLQYADAVFGKDFTNSVLWEVVNLRFGEVPPIKKALGEIVVATPYEGDAANQCAGYLTTVLDGLGNSLVVELGYDNERTAFAILAGAVLFVLDRRHSLSLSRILFE